MANFTDLHISINKISDILNTRKSKLIISTEDKEAYDNIITNYPKIIESLSIDTYEPLALLLFDLSASLYEHSNILNIINHSANSTDKLRLLSQISLRKLFVKSWEFTNVDVIEDLCFEFIYNFVYNRSINLNDIVENSTYYRQIAIVIYHMFIYDYNFQYISIYSKCIYTTSNNTKIIIKYDDIERIIITILSICNNYKYDKNNIENDMLEIYAFFMQSLIHTIRFKLLNDGKIMSKDMIVFYDVNAIYEMIMKYDIIMDIHKMYKIYILLNSYNYDDYVSCDYDLIMYGVMCINGNVRYGKVYVIDMLNMYQKYNYKFTRLKSIVKEY